MKASSTSSDKPLIQVVCLTLNCSGIFAYDNKILGLFKMGEIFKSLSLVYSVSNNSLSLGLR